MLSFFASAILAALVLDTHAHPAPQDPPLQPRGDSKFEWKIWKACPQEQKDAVFKAWEDSKRLADALNSWRPDGDYQEAMSLWMGDRSTFKDGGDYNYPKLIQDTARRRRKLHDGISEYGNANLWVYCNEDSFWFSGCKKSNTGAVVAYEQEDAYFNNWYITFCPIFYDEGQPLDDVFKRIREKQWDANVMENYDELPLNQAHTFFHETMHLTRLTVEKYVDDAAYGAENVYKLARERNADISTFNADSWAYTALAILAQNEFKLEHPPYPYKHPRGQAEIAESSPRKVGNSESVVYKTAKDKDLKSHENPDLWETWSPGPVPQCQGETAFSQPAAEKAIDAFCSDPDHNKVMLAPPVSGTQKVKNRDKVKAFSVDGKIPLDGSELDLHFQVSINEGGVGNGAFDFGKDMCSKMMNIILNGCDNQTIDKKLGGYIVNGDSSGIYRMAAKPKGFTGDVFPKLKSNDDRSSWQWKCEDTDNSKVFFDWQKNSCTCRYLELGGLIDWFAKPDGDGCSRIKGGEYTIPLIEFV